MQIRGYFSLLLSLSLLAPSFAAEMKSDRYTPLERKHWAFQKRADVQPPVVAGVTNPIDAFVRAKLEKEGLKPAAPADRATLARRVYFDLTGLPPTPEEIQSFVNDRSPKAYENLVDRLLASQQYAEKWGNFWLDVVRFAETDGFEYDSHRTDAWRYRDYAALRQGPAAAGRWLLVADAARRDRWPAQLRAERCRPYRAGHARPAGARRRCHAHAACAEPVAGHRQRGVLAAGAEERFRAHAAPVRSAYRAAVGAAARRGQLDAAEAAAPALGVMLQ